MENAFEFSISRGTEIIRFEQEVTEETEIDSWSRLAPLTPVKKFSRRRTKRRVAAISRRGQKGK